MSDSTVKKLTQSFDTQLSALSCCNSSSSQVTHRQRLNVFVATREYWHCVCIEYKCFVWQQPAIAGSLDLESFQPSVRRISCRADIGMQGGRQVLRISVERQADTLSLVLEGRLVGPWVDELRRVSRELSASDGASLTVDLCGLTAMDARGQDLLNELRQAGATLRCTDVMNQYLVEQMARPAGDGRETCRPCRRFPSQKDLPVTAEDALASSRAS